MAAKFGVDAYAADDLGPFAILALRRVFLTSARVLGLISTGIDTDAVGAMSPVLFSLLRELIVVLKYVGLVRETGRVVAGLVVFVATSPDDMVALRRLSRS